MTMLIFKLMVLTAIVIMAVYNIASRKKEGM